MCEKCQLQAENESIGSLIFVKGWLQDKVGRDNEVWSLTYWFVDYLTTVCRVAKLLSTE